MARVVVVGAGVGGLCAALRLAAGGHDVTVCEAAPEVGGKLGRWSADGFTFDTGPSLLTMPQVFAELFSDVGADLREYLELEPLDPLIRYRWADGTVLDTASDANESLRRFSDALGPHAAEDWNRLLQRAAAVWRAVHGPVLRTPSRGLRTFLPLLRRVGDLRRVAPNLTLRDLGLRHLRDPRQRMILDRYATYTGSDPRRAPAALLSIAHAEQAFGGWYVRGGLYRIAEVIAGLAVERGAKLRLETPVARIRTSGNRVRAAVLQSGETLPADVVVSNVDARQMYGDPGLVAPSGMRMTRARRRLATAAPSSSGFVLLLGLRGTSPGLAHHNVWFPRDYDAEFDALFGPEPRPVADPTVYVSRPRDPEVAPSGCESLFVLVNAPLHRPADGGPDWADPSLVAEYRGRIHSSLAQRGVDVDGRIMVEQVLSPADLERRTGAPGGAIYGPSSNGPSAAFLRAPNVSPVRGLFLVGGSAHPGGGLPLVALSADMVARLVGPA